MFERDSSSRSVRNRNREDRGQEQEHQATEERKMRLTNVISLSVAVTAAVLLCCCEGSSGPRRLLLPEDSDDDFRLPAARFARTYRDYAALRPRAARADDSFDDYGHLRFGRSED
ncbi:hypothetical protein EVAR_33416_1 [Eumeta japonica]|uniref:Sulfakinin n=1 Tax=Eumeta variegata TaxID=151549 RepID=A0A4C1W109_EUMVA|nr:hypothetical protein EVAR_33416_1 [Eumeta japonica]